MTEEFQELRLSKALYPAPPPFWQAFTVQNINQFKEADSDGKTDDESRFDTAPLPYELTLLRPPPHPTKETTSYSLFNLVQDLPPKPTLPVEDERLFDYNELTSATGSARPHARHLRQLLKSLNLNFLELYSIMGDNPVEWEDKLRDIGILLENFNSIINVLRPHQAREQLKTMLESRLDDGKEEMERMEQKKSEIEAFLKSVEDFPSGSQDEGRSNSAPQPVNGSNGVHLGLNNTKRNATDKEIENARRTWDLIEDLDDD